jgi:UDP-N-acetylmuramoyl-tripeptide--D-alanyl-D-alanine ligase
VFPPTTPTRRRGAPSPASAASATFALDAGADCQRRGRWTRAARHWARRAQTPGRRPLCALQVAGLHNVRNALAATACALAAGCPLEAVVRGLAAFEPVNGRSQVKSLQRGERSVTLVDDTYNANPDSVRAAIDVLAGLPQPRWLVLGDMGEVGKEGVAFHAEVGAYAKQQGVDALWTTGALSTHAAAAFSGARHFDDVASLVTALAEAPACAAVLVKGSRFMKMERVVAARLDHRERTCCLAWRSGCRTCRRSSASSASSSTSPFAR